MNDQECEQVYHQLLKELKDNGVDWIINQVNEELTSGKAIEKTVDTIKEISYIEHSLFEEIIPKYRKGPKVTFPATESYSKKEQLILLLNAIEQGIINATMLEVHTSNFFHRQIQNTIEIEFYADEMEQPSFKVDTPNLSDREKYIQHLKKLLDKLRDEI